MSIKIAYQGIVGSNNETAAQEMAAHLGLNDVEYLPLVTSPGVVRSLLKGEADYGVMAIHNVVAGDVIETLDACKDISYRILTLHNLPIHHCLFVKEGVSAEDIESVASHIQALSQCKDYLQKNYPNVKQQELEDTALGAQYLYDGTLPATTGVLCRRNAGEAFGLTMIAENIEDFEHNFTTFFMIQKT